LRIASHINFPKVRTFLESVARGSKNSKASYEIGLKHLQCFLNSISSNNNSANDYSRYDIETILLALQSNKLNVYELLETAATRNRQKEVGDKDRAILYGHRALWEDFRISAFGVNQTNPDLIFIDLDARDFVSKKAFKMALTKTLKNIKDKPGGYPAVDWSGRGYHVIQPIDCPVNLDKIEEFAALTIDGDANKQFLQFVERYLTGNKSDTGHHAALESCMIRVPGSLNSKCKDAGIDAEVKILQRWDGRRPDYRLLLGSFYASLVDKRIELEQEEIKRSKYFAAH
jgi:hypothetical protein